MGRMIWAILGAILAAWLAFMAIGWIVATVKTFVIIGLIAVVVAIVVWLLAKPAALWRGNGRSGGQRPTVAAWEPKTAPGL